jgi:hypothetical protein
MKRLTLLIAATSLLLSCAREETHPKPAEWQEVAIGANVLPLVLLVPDGQDNHLHSRWNETFGRLELIGDENDEIFIKESEITCEDKKRELNSSIFQVSYLEESDSILIYQTSVPGGEESYWNVFAVLRNDSTSYTAEQNPLIAYDREDIARLSSIIKRIKPN